MNRFVSLLLVAISVVTHRGSSQSSSLSRRYIPTVQYFSTHQNNLNALNSDDSIQHVDPYATNQRSSLPFLSDSPSSNIVKSVYFFEPQAQKEETRIRISFPPPQKKARVIFIKAPETNVVTEVIPPRPVEERTVVYVLSKKLEPLGSITIPSQLTTAVKRKPEVYFIKYRDLEHAQKLLSETLKGGENGASVPTHSNANSFLKSLDVPNKLTNVVKPDDQNYDKNYFDLVIFDHNLLKVLCSLALIAVVSADVSHLGYRYQSPSGSYLPSYAGVDHISSGSAIRGISGSYLPAYQQQHVSGGDQFLVSGGSHQINVQGFGQGHGADSGFGHAEQTEVHFYGGDDHSTARLRIHVAPVATTNRVLFVKSPDAGSTVIPEIIAPSAGSVDRTVVYVLSKKQDSVGQINIPSSVHNVVKSKPQVYYLRYKDAQDAERAVAETLGGKSLGSTVRHIADKDAFVKSLATGAQGGISGVLGSYGVSGGSVGHDFSGSVISHDISGGVVSHDVSGIDGNLILTAYLSLAFAQVLPSISSPSSSADFNEYYKSQKAASEEEKLYYDSVSSKNVNYQPNLWTSVRPAIPYWASGNGIASPILGGTNSFDSSQYYKSKAAASEEDQSYYANAAVNNGNYWPTIPNYVPNIYPINNYRPSVYPSTFGGGSIYDVNQYYNSKKAASEVDQGYYANSAVNNGNYWPGMNPFVPNGYSPVLNGGSVYDVGQYYNSKAASSELDQGFSAKSAVNNANYLPWLQNVPGTYPVVSPALNGGSAYDVAQYYNSKAAASELDQSFLAKSAVNNGNYWPVIQNYLPSRYPTPFVPGVNPVNTYWPSVYPSGSGGGSIYDMNQYYNSRKAASEIDQSYLAKSAFNNGNYWPSYYPSSIGGGQAYDINQYYNSKKAASETDQSYFGKYGSYDNFLPSINVPSQVWPIPSKPLIWPSARQYPIYAPLTGERVVSENMRDRESSSSNDESSYLNNYYLSNLGAGGETASSQSSSRNQESDKSYDFSDISRLGYGSPVVPIRYRRNQH
ncbi:hypothetical protein RN001_010030 [Aquatica leii]|uniref:DUF243 domain-containing protein n=1 Tax=Aquatica leii TaxID=1421715 RepID=A0AAN7P5V4_9COLE|nr:hypothetical protein RN001_010030 [Aquatica leii]